MRRNDWEKIAMEEARKVLAEEDYNNIITAIEEERAIMFKYKPLRGGKWWYRAVIPTGFIYAEDVYLWAYHVLHKKEHSFRAWEIFNVILYVDIVEAVMDMQKHQFWWSGEMAGEATTPTT